MRVANKKREIIVHCEFVEGGESVKDILYEVFRIFVQRKLRENAFFDR